MFASSLCYKIFAFFNAKSAGRRLGDGLDNLLVGFVVSFGSDDHKARGRLRILIVGDTRDQWFAACKLASGTQHHT